MRSDRAHGSSRMLTLILLGALTPAAADAQTGTPPAMNPERGGLRLGIQGFGAAGVEFPIATDSLTAADLQKRPFEAGGGAQVTNIWRGLFIQGSFSRWRDTGERAFIDSEGNRFGLGIPLSVESRYIDVGAGWRFEKTRGPVAAVRVVPYVGGGAGILQYEESSPFALPGENIDERYTTYHAFAGAEYWILNWLAVSGDVKYRFVRDVLGAGGVSGVLGEDAFDGTSLAVRVLIGPGGPLGRRVARPEPPVPAPAAPSPATAKPPMRPAGPETPGRRLNAVTNAETPVFITPDPTRVPLRVLHPGTAVQVRRESGDWMLIEFTDPLWGPRVGYVQRKNIDFASE